MLKDLISKPGILSKCHALFSLQKSSSSPPWPWLCERREWQQNLLAGCWFFLLEDTNIQKKSSNTSSIISPTQKTPPALPLRARFHHPGISGMDTCLFPDYRIITFWFLAPKCCFFRLILSTSLSETLLKKAHLPTLSLQIFEQSFVQRHLTCH